VQELHEEPDVSPADLVFLLDVDNALLDNDHFERDLRTHLTEAYGRDGQAQYWRIFEQLRAELGYADYLGALQRFRLEYSRDPHLLDTSLFLVLYPFAERLFPRALDVVARLERIGPVVILSDGDVVFQPLKIVRSGLWDAVAGRVLIWIHKEHMLSEVERRYPARHYVMVDDKSRILSAVKETWDSRVTTVFVRQGHYAHDRDIVADEPPADASIDGIAELMDWNVPAPDAEGG
jgi:FMN phosphatase YigB (HAD superfamily)